MKKELTRQDQIDLKIFEVYAKTLTDVFLCMHGKTLRPMGGNKDMDVLQEMILDADIVAYHILKKVSWEYENIEHTAGIGERE